MNYSIQQDLARNRVDDLLRTATHAQLAAETRAHSTTEPTHGRFHALLAAIGRRAAHLRPAPVA